MVSFVLLAPLRAQQGHEITLNKQGKDVRYLTPPPAVHNDSRLQSRGSYQAQALNQTWTDLAPHNDVDDTSEPDDLYLSGDADTATRLTYKDFVVSKMAVVECRMQTLLVADVHLRTADGVTSSLTKSEDQVTAFFAQLADGEVEQLESALTDVMAEQARRNDVTQGLSVDWVARHLVVPKGTVTPVGWMQSAANAKTVEINPLGVEAEVGWGNGVIRGAELLADTDWREIVRGLVDAQVVWAEVHKLADISGETLTELFNRNKVKKSKFRKQLFAEIEEFTGDLGVHQLSYDDLMLNVQGIRREIALATLDSWNYSAVLTRIDRRLSDAEQFAANIRQRLERRYQEIVELALFSLAALTLLDLSLSLVGTAYSGSVATSPGEGSPIHLLNSLRAANADILLSAATLLVVAAVGVYLYIRRK